VAYLPVCPGQVQVHVDLTVQPHSSVVVLEERSCPRVLVLESQVLGNIKASCRYKIHPITRILYTDVLLCITDRSRQKQSKQTTTTVTGQRQTPASASKNSRDLSSNVNGPKSSNVDGCLLPDSGKS